MIAIDGGEQHFFSFVSGISSQTSTSCQSDGPESVFKFEVKNGGPWSAEVISDIGMYPRLLLRDSCAGPDFACRGSQSSETYLYLPLLDAGTYFLSVDTQSSGTGGNFRLQTYIPDGPVPGDSCANPLLVVFDGGGPFASRGDSNFMTHDQSGSCASAFGKDVVYQLTAPKSGTLTVVPSLARGNPVVSVRSDTTGGQNCTGALEVSNGCSSGASFMQVPVVAGATYFIWVQGLNATDNGPFTITLALP